MLEYLAFPLSPCVCDKQLAALQAFPLWAWAWMPAHSHLFLSKVYKLYARLTARSFFPLYVCSAMAVATLYMTIFGTAKAQSL
jgi:hypothetical protein